MLANGDATLASGANCQGTNVLPITVAIVGDVRLYREGVATALARCENLEILGTVPCTTSAVQRLLAAAPAVVLLDAAAPKALDAVRYLRRMLPSTKLVAFAVEERNADLLTMAEAGVVAYVQAEASLDDLLETVRGVAREEFVCSPGFASALLRQLAARGGLKPPRLEDSLTFREQQVLHLICQGLSNKRIAAECNISEATVKNHVHRLLGKLKVTSRSQAVARTAGFQQRR